MTTTFTAQRALMNVEFSFFRFLNENVYTVGTQEKTLKQFFTDLMIKSAYPDDKDRPNKPFLALGDLEVADAEDDFFGAKLFGTTYRVPIYGFVFGRGTDAKNKAYRARLMSDLHEMLVHQCGDEGFDLYDADTKALQEAGGLEITNVRARTLPANAPEIESERYKFLFEVDVHYA